MDKLIIELLTGSYEGAESSHIKAFRPRFEGAVESKNICRSTSERRTRIWGTC